MKVSPIQFLALCLTTSAAAAQTCDLTQSVNQPFEAPAISTPDPINSLPCWTASSGCTAQNGDCGVGFQWAELDSRQSTSAEFMWRDMPTAERTAFDLNYDITVSGTELAYFVIYCSAGAPLVTMQFDTAAGQVQVIGQSSLVQPLVNCAAVQVTGTSGGQVVVTYAGVQLASYGWNGANCPEANRFEWSGNPGKGEDGVVMTVDNVTTAVLAPPTLGTLYCMANPNSLGSVALISATGSVVAASNNVTLNASGILPNSFCLFIVSPMQAQTNNPGGSSGNLCVGGQVGRYVGPGQIQQTGAAGTAALAIDLTNTPTPTGFVSIQSGQTWNFQAWYRDMSPIGPTTNFTQGLEITFQ